MSGTRSFHTTILALIILLSLAGSGCNTTRHLNEDEYLLRSNSVVLKDAEDVDRKNETKENLAGLIVQEPNTRFLGIPYKLLLYNLRYEKYQKDTTNFQLQSKTAERPVIYDSTTNRRSIQNMKGYLQNRGYFYARVKDTARFKNRKAYVTYIVSPGANYLINEINRDIDDSTINAIVKDNMNKTYLKKGMEFDNALLELERSRLANIIRNHGYYYFTQSNIAFQLDTFNKQFFRNIENPFESAIDFVTLQSNDKKPTLDIKIIIRADEEPKAYNRYIINRMTAFPDFRSREDIQRGKLINKEAGDITVRYHNYYVREKVIQKHIFLEPGKFYRQEDYDLTITKLNNLGVFQSVRIFLVEDSTNPNQLLNGYILMGPADRYEYFTNLEASTGNTYTAGSALSVGLHDRNFAKGANYLTITATGGVEAWYDSLSNDFLLRTKSIGINASIDFPKFLAPINQSKLSRRNLPRTVIGFGTSLLDRLSYFTLVNTNANMTYKWRETSTKQWEVSPIFINILRLPRINPDFQKRLDTIDFLGNSYRETFIEGESVTFTFTDKEKRAGRDYSYARVALEEAGGLLGGINLASEALGSSLGFSYAQYVKLDFDLKHYFVGRHSDLVFRFLGGIGMPYAQSISLPYIKQYFSGGAYSIRGYRVRALGPGSYYDTSAQSVASNILIDRTGDIKLELNGEYRFDIFRLFGGALELNGAVFADAGNIWLARESEDYPNGEFDFGRLGRDIAIATGAGLRIEFGGLFTIRGDLGFPIKNPDYPVNGGWVIDQIKFGDPTWRSRNLVLNFAIGYPF